MIQDCTYSQVSLGPIGWSLCCYSSVCLYSVVEIQDLDAGAKQRVNGQRLEQFQELPTKEDVERLMLHAPPSIFDGW